MNFLEALNTAAPHLNNEALGVIAAEGVKNGTLTGSSLGRALRPVLGAMGPATTASGGQSKNPNNKATELPESELARASLLENVYKQFGDRYSVRTVRALSRATGLNADMVKELIKDNPDLELTTNSSGADVVKMRGIS